MTQASTEVKTGNFVAQFLPSFMNSNKIRNREEPIHRNSGKSSESQSSNGGRKHTGLKMKEIHSGVEIGLPFGPPLPRSADQLAI